MKIHPAKLNSLSQVKAYDLATKLMARVDSVAEHVKTLDETEADTSPGQDTVSVGRFKLPDWSSERDTFQAGLHLNTETGTRFFAERPKVAHYLGEKLSKIDTPTHTLYERRYDGSKEGPNRVKVRVDKADGTLDVNGYYLGIIPGRVS